MMYGNSSMGYSYSPDRSRDVDRFNPSTAANRPTSYNPYGWYSPTRQNHSSTSNNKRGWYDGAGGYHED